MVHPLQRFQTWFLDKRQVFFDWFSSDQTKCQEPEHSLSELPPPLLEKLIAALQNLPSHPTSQDAIHSALDQALEQWRSHPCPTNNSIVILSSPVTAVSRLLTEQSRHWATQQQIPIRLLQWIGRPVASATMQTKLQQQLGRGLSTPASGQLEIVVIPNLSWCFLRSVDGLTGIDYLQDVLLPDSSRFWVLGSGQVAWQYLKAVCHLEAYCSETLLLPKLKGEQLQNWLKGIVSQFDLQFEQSSNNTSHPEEDTTPETRYFEQLAAVSKGVSTVAVQVFRRSIAYESPSNESEVAGLLKVRTPTLPNLPDTDEDDDYLLYSLLLHDEITLAALAESLGDEPSTLKYQIQELHQAGLIEQHDQRLRMNPIHYPHLKRKLAANNFAIDSPE